MSSNYRNSGVYFARGRGSADCNHWEDYQSTGGKLNLLHQPSNRAPTGPCGWIRAGLFQPLRQTEAKCAPATFSRHYTVILSCIFRHGSCRNYPCPSWLLCMAILSFRWRGSRKSIAFLFEVETSNINCVTRIWSMHTNWDNVIEGGGCNGLPHLLIAPTAQTPLWCKSLLNFAHQMDVGKKNLNLMLNVCIFLTGKQMFYHI